MAKGDPKLEAFPVWEMGQVLLPDQFEALQRALMSIDAARAELGGLPAYGVARLQLEPGLEREGSLAIERLTYIPRFPGPILDVPGNTRVESLNVKKLAEQALDEGSVPVYLHVLDETLDTSMLEAGRVQQNPYHDEDTQRLKRSLKQAVLSTKAELDERQGVFKVLLFELEYGPLHQGSEEMVWSVGSYAPALTRVGGSSTPYLEQTLQRNLRVIESTVGGIQETIDGGRLSREYIGGLRRIRGEGLRLIEQFRDIGLYGSDERSLSIHPYLLFRALRDFYIDLTSTLELERKALPAYDHEQPRYGFEALADLLENMVLTSSLNTDALVFERDPDFYYLRQLPRSAVGADEVFLIIRFKTHVEFADDAAKQALLDDIKLTSPRRYNEAVTYGVPGVGLELVTGMAATAFTHKYGEGALVGRLRTNNDPNWASVREEGGIQVPISDERLDALTMYLLWRKESLTEHDAS